VQLGDAEVRVLLRALDQLVDAVRVRPLVLLGPDGERAETTSHDADVGGVEVRVDVVRDLLTEAASGGGVGRAAQILEGSLVVEGDGLGGGDPLAVGCACEN